jgi:alkyl hydroperoxide reductase subunit AhpC
VNFPIIGDPQLNVSKLYNMLPADAGDVCEGRATATNATVRAVFVTGTRQDQVNAQSVR